MSGAKHTPGPWKADVRAGCVAVYPASEEVNCFSDIKKRLAYFNGYKTNTKDNLYEWNVDPEDVANAHIMAAAPELYEALKVIVDNCKRYLEEQGPMSEEEMWDPDYVSPLTMAKRAIAKAEGKAGDL